MLSILAHCSLWGTSFHSRLSLCNRDLVEYVYFWITWKVLKTSQEQMDSMYVSNEFSCVMGISGESFVLPKVIKLSAVPIQMQQQWDSPF